jgi:hypothetical protein
MALGFVAVTSLIAVLAHDVERKRMPAPAEQGACVRSCGLVTPARRTDRRSACAGVS